MTQTFEPSLLRAHRAGVIESMRGFVAPSETICGTIVGYQLGLVDRNGSPCEAPSSNFIRAALCMWAVAACEGDTQAALPVAASIEFIHAFTRIHDDIQTGARAHGPRETVWSLWGLGQAVNGGDAMHSLALSILSQGSLRDDVMLRTFELVVRAVRETMDGSVRAFAAPDAPVSRRGSFHIALRRTGALVGAALEAGAVAAEAPARNVRLFRRAGRLLGVALSLREAHETGRALPENGAGLAHRCALRARTLIESCGVTGTWLQHFEEIADYTTSWT
jgi:geranylgeranyl diphosphate synthase type I